MQQENTQQTAKISPFPITSGIIDQTMLDIEAFGDKVFENEILSLGKANPYLLSAIAGISNIFQPARGEVACIQGALCMYHLTSISAEEKQTIVPFVTEKDMMLFISRLNPGISSLSLYIAEEITRHKFQGDEFLFKTVMQGAHAFDLNEQKLIAFGTGIVMTYHVLEIAQESL